jgi:secondary thiamine-phosphate synthase enzyme
VHLDLSAIATARVDTLASATLAVDTPGEGFFEITQEAIRFLAKIKARNGVLLLFIRHTSASLVIQENADPDVRTDLVTALQRLAPANASWVHDIEGPDDMPAHVKSMLNGVALHVPVIAGAMALGTWQGIYVAVASDVAAPARGGIAVCRGERSGVTVGVRPTRPNRALFE